MLVRKTDIQTINLDGFTSQDVRRKIFNSKKTNYVFEPGFEIDPGPVIFYSEEEEDNHVSYIEIFVYEVDVTRLSVLVKWRNTEFKYAEATV